MNTRDLLPDTSEVPAIVNELDEPVLIPKDLEHLSELVTYVMVARMEGLELTFKGVNIIKREGSTDLPSAADRFLHLGFPLACHKVRVLAPLLLALGRAGIELAPHPTDAGRLRHRPADLTPVLLDALRRHRGAILGLLVDGYTPDANDDPDAAYINAERLGIADGLGMPTHPGSAAWLMAVGESMWDSCEIATHGVHSGHGSTDEGDSGGGEGERRNALRDRQGRGRGP